MAILVELDEQGRKIYRGFLSGKETEEADLLLGYLQDEIPKLGKILSDKYGDSVLYKYFMGKRLGELLEEYKVPEKERLYFWNEIKNFASDKERKRMDGGNSKTRKFYEQCFQLSQIDKETVEKLSWRQWQDLMDRTTNREDKRIYDWIGQHEKKIKENEWRAFEKALNLFLKKKDTSVFEDDELFELYEMILLMGETWCDKMHSFEKEYPKSAKIKTKSKWETKFYELCYKSRKANKKNLDCEDCEILFDMIMIPSSSKK